MNKIHTWLHGRWAVPAISGVAIVASLIADKLGATTVGNILMLAAAVVAGLPIAIKAFRSLMVKHISIDLLVSVAAIGAILVGNFWEAAAVTFLFAVGGALEAATLNKTRSALAELVAVAPDTAIVLRDGQQVEISAYEVKPGETVLVKNGAKVPVDGVVIGGNGAINEASITRDVTLALTLLVIGCPGALVISIPVSIVAGIGRGARDGILIKGGEFLETSAKITAVALDKEPGRRLLVSVQVGELGDAVINRTAEGQGIERGGPRCRTPGLLLRTVLDTMPWVWRSGRCSDGQHVHPGPIQC